MFGFVATDGRSADGLQQAELGRDFNAPDRPRIGHLASCDSLGRNVPQVFQELERG